MNFINLKKIACGALLATFVSTIAFATIIPAGTSMPVMDGDIFSELIVSGTLVFANSDPMNPGGGTPLLITITNGDFILCNGGSISQSFDIGTSSSDGADGTAGTAGGPPPTDGDPGVGFGNGGNGGAGDQGSRQPPVPSQQGANGGIGGDCGGNGGAGGIGGTGEDGVKFIKGKQGASGGNGGNGGDGADGFLVTILNTTCDGKIVLTNLNVNLRGFDGGDGGTGGIGGTGGAGADGTNGGDGGDGGTGGRGGNGGAGGNGGSLSLIASNGYVYVPDSFFDVWFEGGTGGDGGPGGLGGNGGDGGIGVMQGGDGGDNGDGGDGGDGGTPGDAGNFSVLAAKVYTNSTRLAVALGGPIGNAAVGGAGGTGGDPGIYAGMGGNFPGGDPGQMTGIPGNPGNPNLNPGNPGAFSFTGDFIPPVLASSDPVIKPAANSGLHFTYQTNLMWNLSVFTDIFTEQKWLRHTIQIVNTNDPTGAAVSTIATDYYNIPANTNFLFSVQNGWQNEGYYFRFLTFDKADNVTTNLYPAQTDNYFEVIPEPGTILVIALGILTLFSRPLKNRFLIATIGAFQKRT